MNASSFEGVVGEQEPTSLSPFHMDISRHGKSDWEYYLPVNITPVKLTQHPTPVKPHSKLLVQTDLSQMLRKPNMNVWYWDTNWPDIEAGKHLQIINVVYIIMKTLAKTTYVRRRIDEAVVTSHDCICGFQQHISDDVYFINTVFSEALIGFP